MACGTGKTFTTLRIAERFVADGESILFLAPTIALVSQARREWLTHTARPLSSLVVCSDPYAGGKNEQEDIQISELECPVVSKPEEIAAKLERARYTKVVFCTYQSLMRVVEAQKDHGTVPFALTVADEAHRTTGVLNRKNEKVDFQLVHDEERLHARKRLYMTATPRIYTEKSKSRMAKREIEVVDMSDETVYGPQFHRLRFKTAVDAGKLSDYRVIVLGVDQSRVPPGLRTRLEGLAEGDQKSPPTLNDITRVLGVSLAINGLSEGKGIERPGPACSHHGLREQHQALEVVRRGADGLSTQAGHDEAASRRGARLVRGGAAPRRLGQRPATQSSATGTRPSRQRRGASHRLQREAVHRRRGCPQSQRGCLPGPEGQPGGCRAGGRSRDAKGRRQEVGYIVVPVVVRPGMDVADALQNSPEGYHTLGKVLRALQAHDERLHEDIARFVQVHGPKPKPNAPGDPGDDPRGLFDDLELEPADEGIFAHVAAASGLGQPGRLVADEIAWAVQRAAEIFQREEVEAPLADALDLPADDEAAKKAVRTVAALLLCNACLMHRRLRDLPEMKMLPGLGRVGATDDPASVLSASWSTILELDYAPVFEPALAALKALPNNKGIQNALRGLSECADNLADSLNDLGYDHAGPLYHRILGSAQSDGAYYTNNVSALMLARLALDEAFVDWSDPLAVEGLRIIDPACGTGTLLMAALRTIKSRMRESGALGEGNDERLHRTLVEDVLCGLDINRHGVQLAACNLTLGAPSVDYRRMNLHTMRHGPQDDGAVRAGSLEILRQREDGPQPTLFSMASKLQGTDAVGGEWEAQESDSNFPLKDVDLVIMNPPFTANDKRGRKFTGDVKKQMQQHELRIRNGLLGRDEEAGAVINTNSIRTFFTPLADQVLKQETAALAKVAPATAWVGTSGEKERRLLATRFHVERVVTSHDPKRSNFSENTGIHECLLVCRRRGSGPAGANRVRVAPTHARDREGGHRGGGRHRCRQRSLGHPHALARRADASRRLDASAVVRRVVGLGCERDRRLPRARTLECAPQGRTPRPKNPGRLSQERPERRRRSRRLPFREQSASTNDERGERCLVPAEA